VLSLSAETVSDNFVNENNETYIHGKTVEDLHTIKTSYLDPLMVSSIQQLEKRVSEQQTQLENILERLAVLETN